MAHMLGRRIALVLLGCAACAGCTNGIAGGAADGPKVFAEACAACHGPSGRPPEALVASLGVRDLTAPEFRARVSEQLVEHQVRTGAQNGKMPSFVGTLTDAQITAVAAYVTRELVK
jgi:cytochrome c oxidase cbb3-type subunit III